MSAGSGRADAGEYTRRVNAARELLGDGVTGAEAAHVLAERFGCSPRQAHRYVQRGAAEGPLAVPEATTVFTVRVQAALANRVRRYAREQGRTISAVVAEALAEYLARAGRERLE
jgi:predicted DsbA family dithiol-disulfide isomerase